MSSGIMPGPYGDRPRQSVVSGVGLAIGGSLMALLGSPNGLLIAVGGVILALLGWRDVKRAECVRDDYEDG
jgi:hypothetical protein